MNNKEKYREFCQTEQNIAIFSKAWWLDAVCGKDQWDVVLAEKDNNIVASLPYFKVKKSIFNIIVMPKLTQTMGVYIKYPFNQKYEQKLSYEKQIMNELIEKLPKFDSFNQQFHHSFANWLPFYWKGFLQSTRYTYVIKDLDDLDLVWKNMDNKTRTDIRKAEKQISIESKEDINLFYKMCSLSFERQGLNIYDFSVINKIDEYCKNQKSRKIFFAMDENKQVHAAVYIIWDTNSAYYLTGGGDPKLRNSAAFSLLIWKSIQFASTVTKQFDFQGSMIEPIEKFFRGFGAVQTPYFHIYKINSNLLKTKNIINKIMNYEL